MLIWCLRLLKISAYMMYSAYKLNKQGDNIQPWCSRFPGNDPWKDPGKDWIRSVFILIPKKGSVKECSNYHTIALTSHASKVMLKILQARLQQYVNREIPDVQAGFRKGREIRDQIANTCWIIEKARVPEKHLLWLHQSLWVCGSQQTVENS